MGRVDFHMLIEITYRFSLFFFFAFACNLKINYEKKETNIPSQ